MKDTTANHTFPYYPYQEYYPIYTYWYGENKEDKTVKAFKIIQLLMDKKIVEIDKAKDFIELVDEVVKML